jgi:UrcA family protein
MKQIRKQERHMKRHSVLALLAAAPFAMVATGAPVEGPDSLGVRSMTVHYDAASITDSKSAEKLFFRIRAAAEEVCRLASYPRGYEIWEEHSCAANAVAEACARRTFQRLISTTTGVLRQC